MLANVSKEQILQTSRQNAESKSWVAVDFIPNKAIGVLEVSDIDRTNERRRASNVAQVLSLTKMSSANDVKRPRSEENQLCGDSCVRYRIPTEVESVRLSHTRASVRSLSRRQTIWFPWSLCVCGGLKKLTKRNQIKKKYDAIVTVSVQS